MATPNRSHSGAAVWPWCYVTRWFLVGLLLSFPGRAYTDSFVVSTVLDDGSPGSLRWAVDQANANPGFDRILFDIPGAGVRTITLQDVLTLTESVDVNAKTQPGFVGLPLVEINANGLAEAFRLEGQLISLQGFIVNRFTSIGVVLPFWSENCWIVDNWIGLDADGTNDSMVFEPIGIWVASKRNVVTGNVLSGLQRGVWLGYDIFSSTWTPVESNSISSNVIGLDPSGRAAVPNSVDGVFLGAGAASNFIGPSNVISGNLVAGVQLFHSSVSWNVVFANTIGLDAAGSVAIPNAFYGVVITNGAHQNAVGGGFGGNTISGNGTGILVGDVGDINNPDYSGGWGNWIQGNVVGADSSAQLGVGNLTGIHLRGPQAYWNTILGNLIVSNARWGVYLERAPSNWIEDNRIGVRADGAPLGNGRDGILIDRAAWNTIVLNTVRNNGWDGSGWLDIRQAGGSHTNGFWMNDTAGPSYAGFAPLAWDPSPSTEAVGYQLHIGTQSGIYDVVIDVGTALSYDVIGLESGKVHYFAVRAYDASRTVVSPFSNEVSHP